MRVNEPPPTKLLLVEGVDDKHVVEHLRRKLVPDLAFCCRSAGGCDPLLKAIPLEMRPDERNALGILMDANADVSARWQAIGDRFRGGNVTLPDQPEDGGTVIDGDLRVGVWLMPDNSTPGELENFVAELVPKDDPVWPLAERFIDNIPGADRQFSRSKELCAKLHAWLATKGEPLMMGAAIGTGSLDATAPAARRLADWLEALFGARTPGRRTLSGHDIPLDDEDEQRRLQAQIAPLIGSINDESLQGEGASQQVRAILAAKYDRSTSNVRSHRHQLDRSPAEQG